MFNHLFATILICLGVANTTPISNYKQEKSNLVLTTPKKANITNDYTLDASLTNGNTIAGVIMPTGNSYYDNIAGISVYGNTQRHNFQNNNSYVNIQGSTYLQILAMNRQNGAKWFYQNTYGQTNNNSTRLLFAIKFTPYNYNVNTRMTLRTQITMEGWEDQGYSPEIEWYAYNIYLKKEIYITSSANWDQYIGQQPAINQVNTIIDDITNVNNGFYYTYQQEMITIGQNDITNQTYGDLTQIGLTPDVDNYIFIKYTPMVEAVEMGAGQQTQQTIPMAGSFMPKQTGAVITLYGTNIIPDGTYEVVDIPGLMFEVIGMPFAFVSQAFNLTLFPGTPYQINIANLFLSIIAIFVFVWLIMIFIKMKSGG